MKKVISVHSEPDSSEIKFWGDIVDTTDKMQEKATQGLIEAVKMMIDAGYNDRDIEYKVDLILKIWEAK